MNATDSQILQQVQDWLQQVVIGLNLCPFAKAPFVNQQVHLQISHAQSEEALLADLQQAMQELLAHDPKQRDTTVLIVAEMLQDFFDYNQFLDWADALIERENLHGVVQIASFHPNYQFAQTEPDDPENLTNRAPYPLLHILREQSLEKALARYPHNPENIFTNNIETVQKLSDAQRKQLFPYLFK